MLRSFLNQRTKATKSRIKKIDLLAWEKNEKRKEIRKSIYLKLIDSAQHGKYREVISPLTLRGFYFNDIARLPKKELYNLIYEVALEIAEEEGLDFYIEKLDTIEEYIITFYWGDDEFKYENYNIL